MRFLPVISALMLALCVFGVVAAPAADNGLSPAANSAFITANARKQGVVTLPSGMQYRVLHTGFGKRVGPSDIVEAYYTARLINGAVFDGTSPGLPVFLNVSNVLRGLSQALQRMHEGDRWQIMLPPELGFGARGAGNGAIPPDQDLLFDVTVVSTRSAATAQDDGSGVSISTYNREGGTSRESGVILNIPQ